MQHRFFRKLAVRGGAFIIAGGVRIGKQQVYPSERKKHSQGVFFIFARSGGMAAFAAADRTLLPIYSQREFVYLTPSRSKQKSPPNKGQAFCLANPVDYDTRDGCTRHGAGMGAMHPLYEILHFTTASVTSVKTSSPF